MENGDLGEREPKILEQVRQDEEITGENNEQEQHRKRVEYTLERLERSMFPIMGGGDARQVWGSIRSRISEINPVSIDEFESLILEEIDKRKWDFSSTEMSPYDMRNSVTRFFETIKLWQKK